ncbi:MAG: hypothetical protein P4M11_00985, partial [Candidatus Pacebacteria bacterium]|nr:hypothetical protein [Candidatus Paceibacterota bacterium]
PQQLVSSLKSRYFQLRQEIFDGRVEKLERIRTEAARAAAAAAAASPPSDPANDESKQQQAEQQRLDQLERHNQLLTSRQAQLASTNHDPQAFLSTVFGGTSHVLNMLSLPSNFIAGAELLGLPGYAHFFRTAELQPIATCEELQKALATATALLNPNDSDPARLDSIVECQAKVLAYYSANKATVAGEIRLDLLNGNMVRREAASCRMTL